MIFTHRRALCLGLLATAVAGPVARAAQAPVSVAAASDLSFALDELAARFTPASGVATRITYGASGDLTRQIERGAPFELFFSADEAFVEHLAKRGRTVDAGRSYGVGQLVLFARAGAPPPSPVAADTLAAWLASARVRRLALANPNHAAYGAAARAALQTLGLWESIQDKLVWGENVSQAAQFALTGAADAAFVGAALATHADFAKRGSLIVLPRAWYPPLVQRVARITPPSGVVRAAATQLYDYALGHEAQAVWARYGFASARQ